MTKEELEKKELITKYEILFNLHKDTMDYDDLYKYGSRFQGLVSLMNNEELKMYYQGLMNLTKDNVI